MCSGYGSVRGLQLGCIKQVVCINGLVHFRPRHCAHLWLVFRTQMPDNVSRTVHQVDVPSKGSAGAEQRCKNCICGENCQEFV